MATVKKLEKKIKIVVDQERLRTTEKLRNIMAAQKGDIEAGINILAKYAVDQNNVPVSYNEAKEFLLDRTGAELEQLLLAFNEGVANAVVNPTSGSS